MPALLEGLMKVQRKIEGAKAFADQKGGPINLPR
jgi:hypothetical protein